MEKLNLLDINPEDYDSVWIPEEEILSWFDVAQAGWVYSGNPEDPHAELVSGLCSTGYFDCNRVLCYPNICQILGEELGARIVRHVKPDWVISSPYSAITFGHEVAKKIGVPFACCEKNPEDPSGKTMIWRRRTLPEGTKILQIEELITTSDTTVEIRRAVTQGNSEPVIFLDQVGALVHRPKKLPADYGNIKVMALIEKEIWSGKPDECELCKAGSKRVRPKSHWKELTGKV